MATATDIVNQALQLMGGNQPPVTGVAPAFDTSVAGVAAAALYYPSVRTVARQFQWDFTRATVDLVKTGNAAPFPWSQEYAYPPNAVQVWQVVPSAGTQPLNPLPALYEIATATVNGLPARVIHCNYPAARAVYNALPPESTWDDLFREAVVRLLASNFAMAIAGNPGAMAALLESGSAFETLGEERLD